MAFKDLPLGAQKQAVKVIVGRMAVAYDTSKAALPEVLGVNKSTINNWVYCGRIPYEQLHSCSEETGVSVDWLLNGDEASYFGEVDKQQQLNAISQLCTEMIHDALEFGLIVTEHPNAEQLLLNKFNKSLSRLLGVNNTVRPGIASNGD